MGFFSSQLHYVLIESKYQSHLPIIHAIDFYLYLRRALSSLTNPSSQRLVFNLFTPLFFLHYFLPPLTLVYPFLMTKEDITFSNLLFYSLPHCLPTLSFKSLSKEKDAFGTIPLDLPTSYY